MSFVDMSVVEILKVKIDNVSRSDVLDRVKSFLCEKKMRRVVTVNPEFVIEAQENNKFLEVINNSHLNVIDGAGIRFALWRMGKIPKTRLAGADLVWEILDIANTKKLRVFLVSNKDGLSSWREVRREIRKKYPFLKIDGMNLSVKSCFSSIKNNEKLLNSHVLLCNFGAPHQEFFIDSVSRDSKIRLAMGVGGSFDFISGTVKRAPKWMRKLGLEWLWRFFVQPWRIKRVLKATIIFPLKVILNK